ncbi:MAG: precorrin-6y C5,15-methyltransferase (decarboxylating) subunit CbiE [Desulfobacterales bacterium]|nr:precorrin-6y C5,15-methyltransferase (decarboxylating) subunit CbiE [Desulfobacterales bacterium]
MSKIIVAGVSAFGIGKQEQRLLSGCCCIVAADRYRPLALELTAEVLPVAPLKQALAAIEARLGYGDVGLLASGDPLFFGIGRTLIEKFGPARVVVLPALSSLQLACARFKIPWDDITVISLHGRKCEQLSSRVLPCPKVAVFTDGLCSPDKVARSLQKYLELVGAEEVLAQCRVYVAENLGGNDERLVEGTIAEIAAMDFAALNIMILSRPAADRRSVKVLGLTESEISHSRGLITKDEIRAVTLHKLGLPVEGVLWDIGAGSGSVSVEAARICPGLTVFAVEKEEEQLANIRRNIVSLEAFNIIPVQGVAPEALAGLLAPDRVFVGGSGGRLATIIAVAAGRLKKDGIIVVNCVTAKTRDQAPELLARHGLALEVSQVSVSRPAVREKTKQVDFNPITVVTGKR